MVNEILKNELSTEIYSALVDLFKKDPKLRRIWIEFPSLDQSYSGFYKVEVYTLEKTQRRLSSSFLIEGENSYLAASKAAEKINLDNNSSPSLEIILSNPHIKRKSKKKNVAFKLEVS